MLYMYTRRHNHYNIQALPPADYQTARSPTLSIAAPLNVRILAQHCLCIAMLHVYNYVSC